jgi:hypothetical protein
MMDGSVPDLRRQIAALLDGMIDLDQFQDWFLMAETAIEQRGSEEDVDLLDQVILLLAEYTGDHIDESQVLDALRSKVLAASVH